MLVEHGFQREAGAFCSVLGVTQYLSSEAVEALLCFAASLPTRSEIVFSFVPPDDELEGEELAAAIQSVKLTETMGEPWATRLRPSEALDLLTHFGFGEVFHLTPQVLSSATLLAGTTGLGRPALNNSSRQSNRS